MTTTKKWIKPEFATRPSANAGSTHVRFTSEQLERITRDSELSGETIPNLMKDAYFDGRSRVPLMRKDDARMLIMETNRIGVNLNQITAKLNSGFRAGFYDPLEQIARDLNRLTNFVMLTYGKGQPEMEESSGDSAL